MNQNNSHLQVLIKYVKDAMNFPVTLKYILENGALVVDGYLVWPLDTYEGTSYFAINPDTQSILELDYLNQAPRFGEPVTEEEICRDIYLDIIGFVNTLSEIDLYSKKAKKASQSPAKIFMWGNFSSS